MKKILILISAIALGLSFYASVPAQVVSGRTVYEVLKQQHRSVQRLLDNIISKNDLTDEDYSSLKDQLSTHMSNEEKYFYPLLEQNDSTRELALQAYDAHNAAKRTLSEIKPSDSDKESVMAKVKLLKEQLDRHIQDEEGKIFPAAKKVISEDQAKDLVRSFE